MERIPRGVYSPEFREQAVKLVEVAPRSAVPASESESEDSREKSHRQGAE